MDFEIGQVVVITTGPYLGVIGEITGLSDPRPVQHYLITTSYSETLMVSCHEIRIWSQRRSKRKEVV